MWWGLPLCLFPLALWFALAVRAEPAVWDVQFGKEIADRFGSGGAHSYENRNVFYYIPHVLFRGLPWTILLARRFRGDSVDGVVRLPTTNARDSVLRRLAYWALALLLDFLVGAVETAGPYLSDFKPGALPRWKAERISPILRCRKPCPMWRGSRGIAGLARWAWVRLQPP